MRIEKKSSWLKHLDFFTLDIVVLISSFYLANLIKFGTVTYYSSSLFKNILFIILISNIICFLVCSPYSGVLRRENNIEFLRLVRYCIDNIILSGVFLYVFKLSGRFSRIAFCLTYLIFFTISIFTRTIWKKILKRRISNSDGRTVLILCKEEDSEKIIKNIVSADFADYDIAGLCYYDNDQADHEEYEVIPLNELYDFVIARSIREVYLAGKPDVISDETAKALIEEGVGIQLDLASIYSFGIEQGQTDKVGIFSTLGLGLQSFSTEQLIYMAFKRLFDILVSLIALVFLLPLSLIIKIYYLCCGDKDSIFYTQTRIGKNGKPFEMFKFRTMVPNAEEILEELLQDEDTLNEWNTYHKLTHDPRITKPGAILRKTSLDEFPQFINVLLGEMSLIGPRPLVEGELKYHNGLKVYEKLKPGITSWWACNGRSNVSYEERLELEYYYVKNCSLLLDVVCFIRTILVVFKKTGAK